MIDKIIQDINRIQEDINRFRYYDHNNEKAKQLEIIRNKLIKLKELLESEY